MMLKKDFVITTLAPITFTDKAADAILYETKKYIPGNAIRGAVVKKYLEKLTAESDEFYELFLSGKVCFLPAYPIGNCDPTQVQSMFMPLSIMKDKQDREYADIAFQPVTKAGFKGVNGFVCVQPDGKLTRVNTKVQLEFHMSRGSEEERITGKSEKATSKVFNYEYLEAGQSFKGSLIYDDSLATLVEDKILNRLQGDIFLGRSKNAQYGKCKLELVADATKAKAVKKDKKLYLMALTPYIAYEPWQSVGEAAKLIMEELGVRMGSKALMQLQQMPKLFAKVEDIGGYVGVWQAKREQVTALSPGSLIELPTETIDNELLNKLQDALLTGLGARTEEGYGQFRIWEAEGKLNFVEASASNNLERKALQPIVQQQVKLIVCQRVKEELLTKANKDAAKVAGKSSSAKSILKRVELLMASSKNKVEIQVAIADFKDIAKDNLDKLKLGALSIYECLMDKVEGEKSKQPYGRIDWNTRIFNGKMNQLAKLQSGDQVDLLPQEDFMYKTYWFWFMRHLTKKVDYVEVKEAEGSEQ